MDHTKAISDLQEIRSIMERSQRFLTISGKSAVLAGVYAIMGGVLGYYLSLNSETIIYHDIRAGVFTPGLVRIGMVLLAVLILSVVTGLYFSFRMARKAGQPLLTPSAKRVAIHFAVPLVTGGLFCLLCMWRGYLEIIAASTLIFYGLALWSAGNFTFSDVRILGLLEIVLGIFALTFVGMGHIFWLTGFGIFHILYGIYHHFKYERV